MKRSPKPTIFEKQTPSRQESDPSLLEQQILHNLYAQGRNAETEKFAQTLTAQYPKNGYCWKILGGVLWKMGRFSDSLVPMQRAAQLLPMDYEAFNNLGSTLEELDRIEHAEACYRRTLELKPDFIETLGKLAKILRDQGKNDEALACIQRIVELAPEDDYTKHLISMFTGKNTECAPAEYVAKVFDTYAEKFNNHLQNVLNYSTPEKLVALLEKNSPPPPEKWRILDLGCGTGLVGSAIAPMARQIVGVDLSSKMLEKAKTLNLYQRLECAELTTMMKAESASSYDVIIAADVFVYIGKLEEVIREVKRLLGSDGIFAFSIEPMKTPKTDASDRNVEPDYELNKTGRYSHSVNYTQKLAAELGFTQIEMVLTQIRLECGEPVNGYLVVWRG